MRNLQLCMISRFFKGTLKGIVHPKLIFTYPAIQTHMIFFLAWNIYGDIFQNILFIIVLKQCSLVVLALLIIIFLCYFFPVGKESKCIPIPGDMQRRSDPLHVSSRESGGLLRAWILWEDNTWWHGGNIGAERRWCHRFRGGYVTHQASIRMRI